jgi:hypothetical protein
MPPRMRRQGPSQRAGVFLATVTAMLAVCLLAATGSAMASTEVGNDCESGVLSGTGASLQLTKDPASPLPIAFPASGVVTSWKVNLLGGESFATQLKVFRPTGAENQFQVVGESSIETAAPGPNTFLTRIPVQAGDRPGTSEGNESGKAFFCGTGKAADKVASVAQVPPLGSVDTYTPFEGFQVGVLAVVEPDADGDGYGDETQDLCPQSAQSHFVCPPSPPPTAGPPLTLESHALFRRRAWAVIEVTASLSSDVTVSASARLPKRRRPARASAQVSVPPLTKAVPANQQVRFKLIFPKRLRLALRNVAPRKFLKLRVLSTTTDPAGNPVNDSLILKLKGQKRSRRRR